SILSPSTPLFAEGETVIFQLAVSDPETASPSSLLVNLVSSVDGVLVTGVSPNASGTYAWANSALSAATHTVTATVTDPDGAQGTDAVVFTVNAPPEITILSPLDGEVFASGSPVNFEAVVSDLEDEASGLMTVLGVVWESDLDGVLNTDSPVFDGVDWVLEFDSFSLPMPITEAEHTLTLTVTDADGASFASMVSFALNEAPTAPGIVLSPANPFTGDDLLATVTTPSTDPEGGAILYDYVWTRDGVPAQSTLSTTVLTDTISSALTSHFEVWEVIVWAVDDTSNATPSLPASVMIANTPPGGTAPTLIPEPAYETTTLECDGANPALDVDGDAISISYEWHVNGVPVSASGATLDGLLFDKGDEVDCAVVFDDGYDLFGLSATNVVTVENSPPGLPSAQIAPASPQNSDDLICVDMAPSTDADGDPVSYVYEWYRDGLLQSSMTFSIVPSSSTLAGDVWGCRMQAPDGEDSSLWSPMSPSVFINGVWEPPVSGSEQSINCGATATCALDEA
ncbi:MAG: hypothetical protein AAB214_03625, partial [Fibrobacterota bacterium]